MEPYQRLEVEWSTWNDLDPAGMVVCASGTAALHLALEALRLPPGSEVLVPDYTMIACPRSVTLAGLTPVFVDCDDRLLMDFDLIREPYPAAVMAVHVYGRRCNMEWFDGLEEDADTKVRTYLIEDLAEAHGVRPYRQTDAACWSFYANKIVAGEEGGAAWFRDPAHAALARRLRNLGFTDAHDFRHVPRGHNYRLANTLAMLVRQSLARQGTAMTTPGLPAGLTPPQQRRLAESWYDAACPVDWRMPPRDVSWVYDLRIPGLTAERQTAVVAALNAAGIAARHGFQPCSSQEEYRGCHTVGSGNAARLASRIIYLPLTPGQVTEESTRRAFGIVHHVLGQ